MYIRGVYLKNFPHRTPHTHRTPRTLLLASVPPLLSPDAGGCVLEPAEPGSLDNCSSCSDLRHFDETVAQTERQRFDEFRRGVFPERGRVAEASVSVGLSEIPVFAAELNTLRNKITQKKEALTRLTLQ
ncbi:hypothetical protein BaRGS_00004079 [Batillaria attramentaria]|uniref:Uncharacterized protein n=1 Tax=Batillaria attramentaria TaxID=370345 RepID=A0ABD0LYR8_9CAEN